MLHGFILHQICTVGFRRERESKQMTLSLLVLPFSLSSLSSTRRGREKELKELSLNSFYTAGLKKRVKKEGEIEGGRKREKE